MKSILHLTQHLLLGVVHNWVFKDSIKDVESVHPSVLLSSAGQLSSSAVTNIKVRPCEMEREFLPFTTFIIISLRYTGSLSRCLQEDYPCTSIAIITPLAPAETSYD